MINSPTFNDILSVMSAASVGDTSARVVLADDASLGDDSMPTRFGIALNLLLDDLAVLVAEQLEEKLRIEQQLRQAQKLDAVGRLAGGVAHDFNNLLSVVLSYSEMALEDINLTDALREDLEEIKNAGERAAELTKQLLAFSRQQVVEPMILDLNHVLTGMDRMITRLIGEDIEFKVVTAPDLRRIKADRGHLEQVVMNLALNARDAMPDGGSLTIETKNAHLDKDYARSHPGVVPGPHALLVVRDTGTGMDDATRDRIFEPFFTTKEVGKGTGLGLATVFGIVRQNGGSIWVESELGLGTTFKIFLPQTDETEVTAPPPLAAAIPGQSPRESKTILLVEDEEALRGIVRRILVRKGYTVLDAQNGGEALMLCEQHKKPIDLLLTDVVMPKMSGPVLAQRLALLRPQMRVLFMSGYLADAMGGHGVLPNGIVLLQKPITRDALLRKVREMLD